MKIVTNNPEHVSTDLRDYKSLDYMYSAEAGEITLSDDNLIADLFAFLSQYNQDAVIIDHNLWTITINIT